MSKTHNSIVDRRLGKYADVCRKNIDINLHFPDMFHIDSDEINYHRNLLFSQNAQF